MGVQLHSMRDAQADGPPQSEVDLRQALRRFATGVTVVTGIDGSSLVGSTANSFTSVSLDPPLVLVCLDHSSRCYAYCARHRRYAINILSADQGHIARGFAVRGGDRGQVCRWHLSPNDLPILEGVHAAFECELVQEVGAADHAILIGRVIGFGISGFGMPGERNDDLPLIFYGGQLFGLRLESVVEPFAGPGTARRHLAHDRANCVDQSID